MIVEAMFLELDPAKPPNLGDFAGAYIFELLCNLVLIFEVLLINELLLPEIFELFLDSKKFVLFRNAFIAFSVSLIATEAFEALVGFR